MWVSVDGCGLVWPFFGWVWVSVTFFDRVWVGVGECDLFWPSVGGCGWVWPFSGWVWVGVGECGWVWVSVGECTDCNCSLTTFKNSILAQKWTLVKLHGQMPAPSWGASPHLKIKSNQIKAIYSFTFSEFWYILIQIKWLNIYNWKSCMGRGIVRKPYINQDHITQRKKQQQTKLKQIQNKCINT